MPMPAIRRSGSSAERDKARRGRSSRHGEGNQRQRSNGGLDPATGLPAFLTRTGGRGDRDRAEA